MGSIKEDEFGFDAEARQDGGNFAGDAKDAECVVAVGGDFDFVDSISPFFVEFFDRKRTQRKFFRNGLWISIGFYKFA